MNPADLQQIHRRLDGLQILLHAQQVWLATELAHQRALIDCAQLRTLPKAKLREIEELRLHREALHHAELLKSYQDVLQQARDQFRLAESDN